MPAYLLDTSTLSRMMAWHPAVLRRFEGLSDDDSTMLCTVVRGEVLYGIARLPQGRKRRQLEATAIPLLERIPCAGIPAEAADEYARIKEENERKGSRLDENDLWIAATALALGATLVTSDTDFDRVGGLKVEDWSRD